MEPQDDMPANGPAELLAEAAMYRRLVATSCSVAQSYQLLKLAAACERLADDAADAKRTMSAGTSPRASRG